MQLRTRARPAWLSAKNGLGFHAKSVLITQSGSRVSWRTRVSGFVKLVSMEVLLAQCVNVKRD
jgi:hypothetical protein